MNICIYGASSAIIDKAYIDAAYDLAAESAKRGHALVFGAGANGVMGASARGAYDNGGVIIGTAPRFFNVDGTLFDKCDEMIYTDTMRERKQVLEERSDGFVVAPGGIGTFEEFFEVLTLKQLGQHNKPIVMFNVNGCYDELIGVLKKLVSDKFMTQKNFELFEVFDNVNDVLDYIENYNKKQIDVEELKNLE